MNNQLTIIFKHKELKSKRIDLITCDNNQKSIGKSVSKMLATLSGTYALCDIYMHDGIFEHIIGTTCVYPDQKPLTSIIL